MVWSRPSADVVASAGATTAGHLVGVARARVARASVDMGRPARASVTSTGATGDGRLATAGRLAGYGDGAPTGRPALVGAGPQAYQLAQGVSGVGLGGLAASGQAGGVEDLIP